MNIQWFNREFDDGIAIVECPSYKASVVFELRGGTIIGDYWKFHSDTHGYLIEIKESEIPGVLTILRDMKQKGMNFDDD